MNKQRIEYLFHKYYNKTASQTERAELLQFIDMASDEEITSLMKEVYDNYQTDESSLLPDKTDTILKAVFSEQNTLSKSNQISDVKKNKFWFKYASIAALLFISVSITFVLFKSYFQVLPTEVEMVNIDPGGNKAVLTLADGTTIDLNDISDGEIANEKGVEISKTDDGLVVYYLSDNGSEDDQLIFNSISTPRGGQYQLVLSDGSKVWLNADSKLIYPVAFSPEERRVELIGEAYFEIAKNKDAPFIVSADREDITVLGTQFNVNSYKENSVIKTTVLEGSVRISNSNKSISANYFLEVLKGGEEAVLDKKNHLKVNSVDVKNSIAWKNGLFRFENTDIKEVMQEFSRWYDVEVVFEGKIPNIKLWGRVYRNVSASEALGILGYFDLKYRIVNESQNSIRKKVIISHI